MIKENHIAAKKPNKKTKGWFSCLIGYGRGSGIHLGISVILSVISVVSGLMPYYCIFRLIELFAAGELNSYMILLWCSAALLAYGIKVIFFGLSTGLSHHAAYHILERLRLQTADRFLHAPLGEVTSHSIGEIKNIMVDKIENIEPPLAHMIPERAGHAVLPVVSIIVLALIDWRIALASLVTAPFSMVCMALTFKISGKNFDQYNSSNAYMNSVIVEYIEGIEVIKAFGRAGISYEKYATAITDYKGFAVKWMTSAWITVKLAFALFPSTLLGNLPMCLLLGAGGKITAAEAVLCVMLPMSMVSSPARVEVFMNGIKQIQLNIQELQEYLEMPALPEPGKRAELSGFDVELRNVRFSYTGDVQHEVLHVSLSQ